MDMMMSLELKAMKNPKYLCVWKMLKNCNQVDVLDMESPDVFEKSWAWDLLLKRIDMTDQHWVMNGVSDTGLPGQTELGHDNITVLLESECMYLQIA